MSDYRVTSMIQSENIIRPRKNNNNEAWIKSQEKRIAISEDPILVNFNESGFQTKYIPLGFTKHTSKKQQEKLQKNEPEYKYFLEAVKHYGEEYCTNSSLHGLRYIGSQGISLFERLFWILSFIAAVGFAAYFINNVYSKWNLSPVIVGINPKFKTISSIPFPAITICNMNQVKKSVALDILKNKDEVDMLLLEDVCKVSNSTLFENLSDEAASKWETVKTFMLRVSQPCNEMVVYCLWQGQHMPCNEILNPTLTDEGLCCTFNRVASQYMYHLPWQLADFNITYPKNNIDWTPEVGYPANVTNNMWPFRPEGAGSHLGLTLVTDVNAKDYFCSSTNSVGLKVRLHSPVESPMVADFGFFLHPRKENRIAITPTVDEAAATIYDIPVNQRQCLFSYERRLRFFRTYTQNNCEMECISNFTLEQCSCVPYYLPKNVNTKICGKKKENCYKQAKMDMETSINGNAEEVCHCLPACYEISYIAEVSIGDISNAKLRKPYTTQTELNDLIVTHFYFSHTQFRSYQKSELYGFTEFLANSGGLLGLFLGFSFLSAVEFFYYLTLKLWCVYYKRHTQNTVYPFAK